jgi:Tfp pilus assembly protein PilV
VKYESVPCEPIQCLLGAGNASPLGVDRVRTGQQTRGMCHRNRTEVGTSLIEMMFAMAAGLVVLIATLHALSYFQQQFMRQQREVAQQQDLRLGLEVLEQELRLAGPGSLTTAASDSVEFSVNLQGLSTTVTATAAVGQTALSVEDGRGWEDRKTVVACWAERCETLALARDGQRHLLTVTQPLTRAIPSGAFVSLLNHIRYYSRRDARNVLRLLRQVDGGASVLVGDIREARFSYWDENGQTVREPAKVRLVVVEVMVSDRGFRAVREISLRT